MHVFTTLFFPFMIHLVTQKEYRGLITSCRREIRKAKVQLELSLARRDNKNMFSQVRQQQKEGQGESLSLIGCNGEYCQQG